MKRATIIPIVLVGAMHLSGCMGFGRVTTRSSTGGIDPITMAGIEASNAATQEDAARNSQQALDAANAAAIQAAQNAAAQ